MVTYTVSRANYAELWGLSSDDKPEGIGKVPNGSLFTEIDTGTSYRFNGETGLWFDSTAKYPTKLEVDEDNNVYKVTYSDSSTKSSDFEVVLEGDKATFVDNGMKVSCDAIVVTADLYAALTEVVYDGDPHTLVWNDVDEGYEIDTDINTSLFSTEDIVPLFATDLSITETEIGEYLFGLTEADFASVNTQVKVAFIVHDGGLKIVESDSDDEGGGDDSPAIVS